MSKFRADSSSDPFAELLEQTNGHRAEHGCWAFPFDDGPGLTRLVQSLRAHRILELGTALGYTACCLAAASENARVDTVEQDPVHVALARENVARFGFTGRIQVVQSSFDAALRRLAPEYDLIFFDGYEPQLPELETMERLLLPGGALVTANLNLGSANAALRSFLDDPARWRHGPGLSAAGTRVSIAIRKNNS